MINHLKYFIILGASGDLSKKKIFPSLFRLFNKQLLNNLKIFGYSRTSYTNQQFHNLIGKSKYSKEFLQHIKYIAGQYDNVEDFKNLYNKVHHPNTEYIFYLAIPPFIFPKALKLINMFFNNMRVVIEKPFGRDSSSYQDLSKSISVFEEKNIFRIDHYLGKIMVKNIMHLRFKNMILESFWNCAYIDKVFIKFKELIDLEGRAGYFDNVGIIRDVMQNHLVQVMSLIAMEKPSSDFHQHVRDEKVKLLKCIKSLKKKDCITGQFEQYLDDPGVKSQSKTETFACCVFKIDNKRWKDVPFILSCGKGMDEKLMEIRIKFKHHSNKEDGECNELVIRVQPDEGIYFKINCRASGFEEESRKIGLGFDYKKEFTNVVNAYQSLIMDVCNNDNSNFVRDDELKEAWRLFDDILDNKDPHPYNLGEDGPEEYHQFLNNIK